MSDQLARLMQLQRLKLIRAQQSLAVIKAEEDALRKDLKTLNAHRRQSHATDPSLLAMRSIGADILWQGWIDRTQADLTVDLAKVLVRKEPITRRVARETGRDEVVTELHARTRRSEEQKKTDARLARLVDLAAVFKATQKRK